MLVLNFSQLLRPKGLDLFKPKGLDSFKKHIRLTHGRQVLSVPTRLLNSDATAEEQLALLELG